MAVNPTYPGVYIDEVPSAVRTIIGVPTAVAAFVGLALRGPVDRPRHITSWADFERIYGGLSAGSLMSYAVFHYYQNGGSEAEIVRVAAHDAAATIDLGNGVVLRAKDTGPGGNGMKARVDDDPADNTLYTLTIHPAKGADEAISGIKRGAAPADVDSLETKLSSSQYVRVAEKGANDPAASPAPAGGAGPFDDPALPTSSGGRDGASPSTIRLVVDPDTKPEPKEFVTIAAANPGGWGRRLRARVDYDTRPAADNSEKDKLYNLTVRDMATGAEQTFRNVVADPASANSLNRALAGSDLVTATGATQTGKRPAASPAAAAGADPFADPTGSDPKTYAEAANGDDGETIVDGDIMGSDGANRTGIFALRDTDIFTILCIPPISRADSLSQGLMSAAAKLCLDRRSMLLVDSPPPDKWGDSEKAFNGFDQIRPQGDDARNAALYFPWPRLPDRNGQLLDFPPCGVIAGVWARTDGQRNVAKAPAGLDASLSGVSELSVKLTDLENGRLNPLGINCLRTFPVVGSVVWGARTLRGADRLASEWKYVPVRRTALFIEESLYRGTQWVVFEPNDEPLWSAIRLNVGAFMNTLFRQGMFQGRTPKDAYLVKCDRENNPQNDIDRGIVNILVGFAPLKPAEFVLIHIQQLSLPLEV